VSLLVIFYDSYTPTPIELASHRQRL